ncbi:DUF308 domain-containing protein [Streptomyces sp. NPDC051576]|uniref:DUF308 domain-containing protein n=1 Tax=Streptomyces sp. NPDC051576 TaxID=3155803 RepID=UPI0034352652
MTTTTTAATTPAPTTTLSGLRSLYLIRIAFSLIWVALLLANSGSLVSKDSPSAIVAVLLVVYPLWDVVATLLERRLAGTGSTHLVSALNMALGLAAALGMTVAVFSTVGRALLVFGIWALLSGALQLVTALRRRRALGAQWPMIISGGQSVLAGASLAAMSTSAKSGLSTVAGYSAFGAVWFLVSVLAIRRRSSGRSA